MYRVAAITGAAALMTALVASPASADSESGGYHSCPPYQKFVYTYNWASGTIVHEQMPNNVWYSSSIRYNQPLARYEWHAGFSPSVNGWYVHGSYQNNDLSGVWCATS